MKTMQQIEKEGLRQERVVCSVHLLTKPLLRDLRFLEQHLLHPKPIHLELKQINLYLEHKRLLQDLAAQLQLLLVHKGPLPLEQAHHQQEVFLVQNLKHLLANQLQLAHRGFHLVKQLQHQVLQATFLVHKNHLV